MQNYGKPWLERDDYVTNFELVDSVRLPVDTRTAPQFPAPKQGELKYLGITQVLWLEFPVDCTRQEQSQW